MRARTLLMLVPLLAAAACSSSSSPAADAPAAATVAPSALTGTDAILAAAGPLSAHIENSNHLACDSDQAYYQSDSHGGTSVIVLQFPPPGDLGISYTTKDGQDETDPEPYALMPGDTGHVFDLTGVTVSDVQEINLSASSEGSSGECQVSPGQ